MKNDNPVIIPDMEFKPFVPEEIDKSEYEENNSEKDKEQTKENKKEQEEEKAVITEEMYDNIREELRNELAGELGKQKLRAAHERDIIIHNAKKDAKKLIDEANDTKRQIIEEAETSAEEIRIKAYNEGLNKALEQKTAALDELITKISDTIGTLDAQQEDYFREYAAQLRFVAVEMAEKIINQKILEDDMTMYNLIKNAVKTVRDSAWIKVEISQKLSGYADSLEKELNESGMNAEITLSEDVEEGACIINTPNGMIVASVSRQLQNMREFIERQSKGGNDEEIS
jgi:flagellar assembly protein FliH